MSKPDVSFNVLGEASSIVVYDTDCYIYGFVYYVYSIQVTQELTMYDDPSQQNQDELISQSENNDNVDSIERHLQSEQVSGKSSAEPPETNVQQPKAKKRKLTLIIWIILLIILLMAGGVGVYLHLNKDTKKQTTVKTSSQKVATKTSSITPVSVIDEAKKAITAIYPDVITDTSKATGNQVAFIASDEAPAWAADNSKNYVNYSGSGASSLRITFSDVNSEKTEAAVRDQAGQIREAIIGVLNKENFVLSSDNAYRSGGIYDAYTKDDVICIAHNLNDETITAPPVIKCGNLSKYTTSLESYVSTEPFAKAYIASGDIHVGDVLDQPKISDSETSGYKTAIVGIVNSGQVVGGFVGLFYQKDGGAWQYFIGTQGVLQCSQYNTPDIKAAYKGETCDNGGTDESVVKLP